MSMLRNMCFSALLALLLFMMYACVSEYTPSGIKGVDDLLIVEGVITNDTTYIRLGRSVDLTEDIRDAKEVNNATVYVECDDGTLFQKMTYIYNGEYMIETGQLMPDRKYRLNILLTGNHYQSEYLAPIFTTGVDSIYFTKEGSGKPIILNLTTHDPANQSRYYMWSYKEDWESHALISEEGYEDLYYCWGRDSSRVLKLGSSDKLTENVITGMKLISTIPSHKKFSYLYYVKVAQNQVRKEAYDFFTNQQQNIEQGGLFAPMPSNERGNIKCLTDSEQYVLGYIEVSTTTYIDRFFSVYDEMYSLYEALPIPSICWVDLGGTIPTECIDCRWTGATKKKPAYWPNNHE